MAQGGRPACGPEPDAAIHAPVGGVCRAGQGCSLSGQTVRSAAHFLPAGRVQAASALDAAIGARGSAGFGRAGPRRTGHRAALVVRRVSSESCADYCRAGPDRTLGATTVFGLGAGLGHILALGTLANLRSAADRSNGCLVAQSCLGATCRLSRRPDQSRVVSVAAFHVLASSHCAPGRVCAAGARVALVGVESRARADGLLALRTRLGHTLATPALGLLRRVALHAALLECCGAEECRALARAAAHALARTRRAARGPGAYCALGTVGCGRGPAAWRELARGACHRVTAGCCASERLSSARALFTAVGFRSGFDFRCDLTLRTVRRSATSNVSAQGIKANYTVFTPIFVRVCVRLIRLISSVTIRQSAGCIPAWRLEPHATVSTPLCAGGCPCHCRVLTCRAACVVARNCSSTLGIVPCGAYFTAVCRVLSPAFSRFVARRAVHRWTHSAISAVRVGAGAAQCAAVFGIGGAGLLSRVVSVIAIEFDARSHCSSGRVHKPCAGRTPVCVRPCAFLGRNRAGTALHRQGVRECASRRPSAERCYHTPVNVRGCP